MPDKLLSAANPYDRALEALGLKKFQTGTGGVYYGDRDRSESSDGQGAGTGRVSKAISLGNAPEELISPGHYANPSATPDVPAPTTRDGDQSGGQGNQGAGNAPDPATMSNEAISAELSELSATPVNAIPSIPGMMAQAYKSYRSKSLESQLADNLSANPSIAPGTPAAAELAAAYSYGTPTSNPTTTGEGGGETSSGISGEEAADQGLDEHGEADFGGGVGDGDSGVGGPGDGGDADAAGSAGEFAAGGVVKQNYQEGGVVAPNATSAPVPPGQNPDTADNIDAKLSKDEFVFPAEVARFLGIDKLDKMVEKAKADMAEMDARQKDNKAKVDAQKGPNPTQSVQPEGQAPAKPALPGLSI